jgi:hypothetical protein
LVRRIATVLGLLTDSLLVLVDTGPRDFPDLAGKQIRPGPGIVPIRRAGDFLVCRRTVKGVFLLLLPSHSEQYHPLSVWK